MSRYAHILGFLILQLLYILIWIPLALLGYIIVPLTLIWGIYRESKTGVWPWTHYSPEYQHKYKGLPKWLSIYDNKGDSIFGPPNYYPGRGAFYSAIQFNVVRNPVNGLRFIPPFNLRIKPENVRWIGSLGNRYQFMARRYDSKEKEFYLFCWDKSQPLKANLLFQYRNHSGTMMKFQMGWKVYPKDLHGFDTPYRASGAGNAVISWRKV